MTWMTVPLAPLAVYGIVRTFQRDDLASQVWLAAPLAALWWAHSPIALWFTFIALASQLVRLVYVRHSLDPFKRAMLGAVIFAVLAQYPFVSVAEIHASGAESTVVGTLGHPEKLMGFVRSVFPAVLQPLSDHARRLSDSTGLCALGRPCLRECGVAHRPPPGPSNPSGKCRVSPAPGAACSRVHGFPLESHSFGRCQDHVLLADAEVLPDRGSASRSGRTDRVCDVRPA